MRRFVTPRAAVAVAICLVGAGLAGSASAQELGLIYAVVLDQTGQPLTDLTPEEFQVSEDGNAAEVVSAQVGAEPIKIALLVDNRAPDQHPAGDQSPAGRGGRVHRVDPGRARDRPVHARRPDRSCGGSGSRPTGRSSSEHALDRSDRPASSGLDPPRPTVPRVELSLPALLPPAVAFAGPPHHAAPAVEGLGNAGRESLTSISALLPPPSTLRSCPNRGRRE